MLNELESIGHLLAPDIASVPIYTLDQSILPPELRGNHASGFTGPCVDLALLPIIGSDWRGRGIGMVIEAAAIRSRYERAAESLPADDRTAAAVETVVASEVGAIFLHELGHALERPEPFGRVPAGQASGVILSTRKHIRATVDGTAQPHAIPFMGHGWQWLRILIHLHTRAGMFWRDIPARHLAHMNTYSLSPIEEYIAALGDEPLRMLPATFEQIKDTIPPYEFCRLWNSDVRNWFLTIEPDDRITAVLCSESIFLPIHPEIP